MQKIALITLLLVACLHYTNCIQKTSETGSIFENGDILLDSKFMLDQKIKVVDDVNLEMMMDPEADFGK